MLVQLVVVAACAAAQANSLPHEPRIVGGVDTAIEKHPYQVNI